MTTMTTALKVHVLKHSVLKIHLQNFSFPTHCPSKSVMPTALIKNFRKGKKKIIKQQNPVSGLNTNVRHRDALLYKLVFTTFKALRINSEVDSLLQMSKSKTCLHFKNTPKCQWYAAFCFIVTTATFNALWRALSLGAGNATRTGTLRGISLWPQHTLYFVLMIFGNRLSHFLQ